MCQPVSLPAPFTCTPMSAYVIKTADVPAGTVGGSVSKTAKVPVCVFADVFVEPKAPVVEFRAPRPSVAVIRAIAIIAAIAPDVITLLLEFME